MAGLARYILRVAHGAAHHPWHQLLPPSELSAQELTDYAIHRQGSIPPPSIPQQGRQLAVRGQGAHRRGSLSPHLLLDLGPQRRTFSIESRAGEQSVLHGLLIVESMNGYP